MPWSATTSSRVVRPAASRAAARPRRRSWPAAGATGSTRPRTGGRSSRGRRRRCRSATGAREEAATTAAIRSPTRSAPTYSAPRWAATVRPLPRNSRLLTTVTLAPAAPSRANAVGCGCHSTGSTYLSQNSALSSRSVPGIREVKPTRPCAPGVSPVPSEVRLVAVVDGTPAVPACCSSSRADEERRGVAVAAQQLGAEAVDEEDDVRRGVGQHQPGRRARRSGGRARTRRPGRRRPASAGRRPARRTPRRRHRSVGPRREGLGEGEQPRHRVAALGGGRDPEREVVGGEARRCSRGRRRTPGPSSRPARGRSGSRRPSRSSCTASAGGVGPEVGLAIIRVTTTDFTEDRLIASVEVEV